MKIAPVMRAFEAYPDIEQTLIHTGQHYDEALSDHFFEDLGLRPPDYNLGVGSGSHAAQTGRILIALEPLVGRLAPDWVFTVGDVNSTLAAALVAAKLGIRVAHIEAGLRCHDWWMPEEINRMITDRISSALFTTEPVAFDNLIREGVEESRIHPVGNVMIDTLDRHRQRAGRLAVHHTLGLDAGKYVVVTLHRPRNVDNPKRLSAILTALGHTACSCEATIVLALHPRTARNVKEFGLEKKLNGLHVLGPVRYLEFLGLIDTAGTVITDSGGIQEETTVLGVPCITLRPSTDRPVTIDEGTNRLFNGNLNDLVDVVAESLAEERRPCRPALWDGHASDRIAEITLRLPQPLQAAFPAQEVAGLAY